MKLDLPHICDDSVMARMHPQHFELRSQAGLLDKFVERDASHHTSWSSEEKNKAKHERSSSWCSKDDLYRLWFGYSFLKNFKRCVYMKKSFQNFWFLQKSILCSRFFFPIFSLAFFLDFLNQQHRKRHNERVKLWMMKSPDPNFPEPPYHCGNIGYYWNGQILE